MTFSASTSPSVRLSEPSRHGLFPSLLTKTAELHVIGPVPRQQGREQPGSVLIVDTEKQKPRFVLDTSKLRFVLSFVPRAGYKPVISHGSVPRAPLGDGN